MALITVRGFTYFIYIIGGIKVSLISIYEIYIYIYNFFSSFWFLKRTHIFFNKMCNVLFFAIYVHDMLVEGPNLEMSFWQTCSPTSQEICLCDYFTHRWGKRDWLDYIRKKRTRPTAARFGLSLLIPFSLPISPETHHSQTLPLSFPVYLSLSLSLPLSLCLYPPLSLYIYIYIYIDWCIQSKTLLNIQALRTMKSTGNLLYSYKICLAIIFVRICFSKFMPFYIHTRERSLTPTWIAYISCHRILINYVTDLKAEITSTTKATHTFRSWLKNSYKWKCCDQFKKKKKALLVAFWPSKINVEMGILKLKFCGSRYKLQI